jgi:hypothetical protein
MVAKKTVRVSVSSLSTWSKHTVLGWTWMDVDLQSNELHEIDTLQRVQPSAPAIAVTVERREEVVSGGHGASRKPQGSWSCEQLRGVRVRDSLIPFQLKAANLKNIGLAYSGGMPVWHVQAIDAGVSAWSTNSATVDLYISQSQHTLVRLHLNTVTRIGGVRTRETIRETYRRYGKPITVTVPEQCRQ